MKKQVNGRKSDIIITQTLLQLFIDRWSKPWHAYSEEKRPEITGHYWEHEMAKYASGGR